MIDVKALPYTKDSLKPVISTETVEFHYDKHHKGYANKLNKMLDSSKYADDNLEDMIVKSYKNHDFPVYNNAAQIWNHDFYWDSISSVKNMTIDQDLLSIINANFGTIEQFKSKFIDAGVTLFGSGWIWLVQDKETMKLSIIQTNNADNPLILNKRPILTIDVWEHAYYIDYRNNRLEYLKNSVESLLNWDFAKNNIKF
ncbi:MAG: Fe-Mn family superoxide dismutase [Candidatus Midichloriaceae bacterium]|jgi:Fe-Mn family superoxide dismutase